MEFGGILILSAEILSLVAWQPFMELTSAQDLMRTALVEGLSYSLMYADLARYQYSWLISVLSALECSDATLADAGSAGVHI